MYRKRVCVAALAAIPSLCLAVSTRSWIASTYSDFEKGERKGVSLRSDGRITLAPRSHELFDSSLAYIWALARDSKGAIYAAGGPGARVYRFANGKCEKLAEFDAVEVHALAIDSHDRVYAATFPDGRIYRVTPGSRPEEFYNPKQKYIWSMLFDRSGNLLIATGDHGEIHRVTADGKGSVFFQSEDTHVRSLALDGDDLIAGTDPTGLVIRIDAQAHGFVLYQLPKREITAVAVAPDGSIYAAGAGTQQTNPSSSALLAAITAPAAVPPTGNSGTIVVPGAAEPPHAPRTLALTGGSEVFRIDASGLPQKVWSHPQDVVYSIGFDPNARPILGTGNKGIVYRVDSPSLYTALETINVNQITALLPAPDGSFLAATGNLGKVYRFGPELEKTGVVTSEVFDSGSFSSWGKLTPDGDLAKEGLQLESHSGNLDRPRNYWSAWSKTSPPASRFVQWRATLTAVNGVSPVLDSVEQAYLSRNVAPQVEEIERTPPNYKFPAPIVPVLLQRAPTTLNLPAIGKRITPSALTAIDSDSTMTAAKGWIGIRWTASDENNDPLIYTLQIRGVNESDWKPLKDKLIEKHYSFDSTAYADGEYRVRVIASDQPGNPGGEALTGQLDSAPILIDNTPPVITGLTVSRAGSALRITWKAADALNVIRRAEYAIDGEDWMLVDPVSKLSDSPMLDYALTLPQVAPGEHSIAVRVTDDYDNSAVAKTVSRP